MHEGLTCDKGQCQERINKNGKEIVKICDFKPTIKQIEGQYSGFLIMSLLSSKI